LKINLVYDYRQQATSKLASLGITVKNDRASYDMLKEKFTALQAEYNTEKSALNVRIDAFNQKQQAYETEVNSWNKKGGAPQAEYDKLQAEKVSLQQESSELQAEQAKLNAMVDEINALVVVLNRLVATLNLSVDQYNTVNGSRGESFEEGVYIENGSNREIDIYEFSSRAKLVRVLAHELGHALGLDHVDDPKAIMYKLNQGTSLTLSDADLSALKTKCGIK
jgi:predicted Zn-dependent protease